MTDTPEPLNPNLETIEEEDERDLVDEAMLALQEATRQILDGELDILLPARAEVLSKFVIAAQVYDTLGELVDTLGRLKGFANSFGPMLAGQAASMNTPPFVEGELNETAAPWEPPSWVADVLGPAAVFAGKRQVAVEILPRDGGPVAPEHIEIVGRMREEHWPIERVNQALGACQRPAEARLVEPR